MTAAGAATGRPLLALSGLLLLAGAAIPAPAGALACGACALPCALGAAALTRGGLRLAALAATLGAVVLTASAWPAFRKEQAARAERLRLQPS